MVVGSNPVSSNRVVGSKPKMVVGSNPVAVT